MSTLFTCPRCGSHTFGSAAELDGSLIRYCHRPGCHFQGPEHLDHELFTINGESFPTYEAYREAFVADTELAVAANQFIGEAGDCDDLLPPRLVSGDALRMSRYLQTTRRASHRFTLKREENGHGIWELYPQRLFRVSGLMTFGGDDSTLIQMRISNDPELLANSTLPIAFFHSGLSFEEYSAMDEQRFLAVVAHAPDRLKIGDMLPSVGAGTIFRLEVQGEMTAAVAWGREVVDV